jgi:hypothetical protein
MACESMTVGRASDLKDCVRPRSVGQRPLSNTNTKNRLWDKPTNDFSFTARVLSAQQVDNIDKSLPLPS